MSKQFKYGEEARRSLEKGVDTLADAVDDFCKKHDIKLSHKEMDDFVDDIKDSAAE